MIQRAPGIATPCGVQKTGPAPLSLPPGAGMNSSWAVAPEAFALLKFCRMLSEPRKSRVVWVLEDPDGESTPVDLTFQLEETSLLERQFRGLLGERARAQELGEQDQGGGAEERAGSPVEHFKRVQRGTGGRQELHGAVLPSTLSGMSAELRWAGLGKPRSTRAGGASNSGLGV